MAGVPAPDGSARRRRNWETDHNRVEGAAVVPDTLDRWSVVAGPVVIGIVVGEAFEAPVYPQVLLRHLANLRLDQMVVALGVGNRAIAGEVVERRMDDGVVALRTGQTLEEIGKHGCTRHAG